MVVVAPSSAPMFSSLLAGLRSLQPTPPSGVFVLPALADAQGHFAGFGLPLELAPADAPQDVVVADLNGDGVPDVVALDRNSYLPVHHPEFSLRQRRNEPDWNDLNARNRRILERSQSLVAARNKAAFALRVYPRHLRDGSSVPILYANAPIHLGEALWGNVMIGLDF